MHDVTLGELMGWPAMVLQMSLANGRACQGPTQAARCSGATAASGSTGAASTAAARGRATEARPRTPQAPPPMARLPQVATHDRRVKARLLIAGADARLPSDVKPPRDKLVLYTYPPCAYDAV